jgi:5-methylcytosine-specific restriction endonuclease McrA
MAARTYYRSDEAKAYRHLYKTARWQRLRLQQLERQPLCEFCLKLGKIEAATVADHKIPHRGDANLFFDIDNLQSLSDFCHSSLKQQEENRGYSNQIGLDGRPVDPRHPGHN